MSIALTSLAGLNGCSGGSCAGVGADAVTVTVLDANGKRVCDATVTAADAAFSYTLVGSGDPHMCVYSGVPQQESVYTVSVRAGPATATVHDVKTSAPKCIEQTTAVTVHLHP